MEQPEVIMPKKEFEMVRSLTMTDGVRSNCIEESEGLIFVDPKEELKARLE
jgi:hypothetical protein